MILCGLAVLTFAQSGAHAQVVFSASGANPAAITASIDAFRLSISAGGPNNGGVAGSVGIGRREINWDGASDALSAPNAFPGNFFNVNSTRGAVFSTPGTGFQVSSNAASGVPVRFGNLNAAYTADTQTFSAQKLFTAIGSNIVQVDFFIPGTTTPAKVSGFGAVFTDVETAGSTTIRLFTPEGMPRGPFNVPTSASGGLSFLGLSDPISSFSRVIIQFGTAIPGASESLPGTDVTFMDDFIYGEPLIIPAPAGALVMVCAGALALPQRRKHSNLRA